MKPRPPRTVLVEHGRATQRLLLGFLIVVAIEMAVLIYLIAAH